LYRDIIHVNEAGQRFLFNELYPVLIEKVTANYPRRSN
jgi:hypothetical protein